MRAKPCQTLRLVGQDRALALSRVEVGAAEDVKKFVPDDYDHRGDKRQLGAVLTYRYYSTRPHR